MAFRENVVNLVSKAVNLSEREVGSLLEVPSDEKFGDYAFPCFVLAKKFKKNPAEIARNVAEKIKKPKFIKKVEANGSYLNLFLDSSLLAKEVLVKIKRENKDYGKKKMNKNTVLIEFSSPNIAKPFGIGHLRSTVIGNCLSKVFISLGYNVVGINHLGDWGTQFGKLIVAYKKWGDEKKLEADTIKFLLKLYVKFHDKAEKDKTLDDEARAWFKKLEEGDKSALALWENFRELSLYEFRKIYGILDVEFDSMHGEAFYNDKINSVISLAKKRKICEVDDGALIVDTGKKSPPLMLLKSDGASTYAARDLAAAIYRINEYKPYKLIYVVGSEQRLHFKQVFSVVGKLGFDKEKFVHVDFGMFRFPEGKMSTRKGRVIFLEDVLNKSICLAEKTIRKKNPNLKNRKDIAKWVGVGSIIFADLSNDRVKDIDFDWNRMLSFEGETGPYLQYTHARACSILRKALKEYDLGVTQKVSFDIFNLDEESILVKKLSSYPEILSKVGETCKPHILAHYLISLAQGFNEFYHKCPVICEDKKIMKVRLLLVDCVRQVLENGLNLLGIKAPDEM